MPEHTPAESAEEVLARGRREIAALAGDRYEVACTLAVGGMSVVYRGYDRAGGRPVALKLLDGSRGGGLESRERFRREARISAGLGHPHVVPCYDFLHRGNAALAVMRYVPGVSLAERLRARQRLGAAELFPILLGVSDALAHAHTRQIVHRDVKPGNILLQDEDEWPFLTDFGIATLGTSEQSRSEVSRGFGTPAYMSPEQAMGRWDADRRTDVYSLGLVAWRALTGQLPFTAETDVALAAQRTVKDVPAVRSVAPDVPASLARIVDRAVQRDPRRRWRDASAMHHALLRVRPPARAGAAPRPVRQRLFQLLAQVSGGWIGMDSAQATS